MVVFRCLFDSDVDWLDWDRTSRIYIHTRPQNQQTRLGALSLDEVKFRDSNYLKAIENATVGLRNYF